MVSKRMIICSSVADWHGGCTFLLWMNLPIPEKDLPFPLIVVKLVNLISPMFLLTIAVLTGVTLAHKVGLSAPLAEAIANDTSQKFLTLKPQLVPGLTGGVIGGVVISSWLPLWKSSLPWDFLAKSEEFS